MGIVMYVFDERWPDKDYAVGLHQGKKVNKVVVSQNTYLPKVVEKILAAKQSHELFELIRICAHGDSGAIWLGLGIS